jgi:hypothetical protein
MDSVSEPNFNDHYLVFGHGLRLVNDSENEKNIDSNFPLDPNYRVVTLHTPGKEIFNKLVKIITNQIEKKSEFISQLFSIKCPIARGSAKKNLEDSFIKDYVIDIFKETPDKLPDILEELLYEDPSTINFKTLDELKQYLSLLDYTEIKSNLNFEIRTYRPGELCPKLLIDFKVQKRLGYLKGGLYKVSEFKNFNYDVYDEMQGLATIGSPGVESTQLKSFVTFDESLKYVFDGADARLGRGTSFFKTIRPPVSTGLLIVLSCGTYSDKPHPYVRKASFDRQNAPYRKYYIKYN